MSACHCEERNRPLPSTLSPGANERPRQWYVMRRNYTRSAFNGYRTQWSASSDIYCAVCRGYWRSKAAWVDGLPDADMLAVWPHAEPLTSC